jgi:fumarylpyruvate hydrolase
MIFSMQEIISNLSKFFYLVPGDLIFTGTPQGVATVSKGDKLVAVIDQLPSLCVNVV